MSAKHKRWKSLIKWEIGDVYLIEVKHFYNPPKIKTYTVRPAILLGTYGPKERPLFLPVTSTLKFIRFSEIYDDLFTVKPSYFNDSFTLLSISTGKPISINKMKWRKIGRISNQNIELVQKYIDSNNIVKLGIARAVKHYEQYVSKKKNNSKTPNCQKT